MEKRLEIPGLRRCFMRLAGFSIALVAACLLLFSPAVYADDAEEKADSGDASGVELYMGIISVRLSTRMA
jgi:hypothetical protein